MKYKLKYWFEHGGGILWAINEETKEKYGYLIDIDILPLSNETIDNLNKLEEYVGYYTKGADNVADIFPLKDYTVEEIIMLGEYLQLPVDILRKTPHDGLSPISDEQKLGVKYNDISKYLNNEPLDEKIKEKITNLHNSNKHKLEINYYKREDK